MEYEELLEQYGMEYLQENDVDASLYDMGDFKELLGRRSAADAFELGVSAYSYKIGDPGNRSRDWSWSDDYFFYDGYGHVCSISDHQLLDYYSFHIYRNDFMDWCEEMGYIE